MFDSNRIKKLEDKLKNLLSNDNDYQNQFDTPNIQAKITGFTLDSTTQRYKYSWVGIKNDGTTDNMVGGSDDALCIQEFGKNMTGQEASVKVNDIVSMQCDQNGYRFSLAGGGVMPEFETTLHEHAIPIVTNTGQGNENEAE